MTDKVAEYYSTEEKINELKEYVHLNFKVIHTKMISEMRRKLDINPSLENDEGYVSLMVSLYAAMFNEMVYALCGICQSTKISVHEMISVSMLKVFLSLLEDKNPLHGKPRTDIPEDLDGFKKYYLEEIDRLRDVIEALPK